MKLYIPIVAPKLLDTLEYVSPLGKGGDGKNVIWNTTLAPFIFSVEEMDEDDETHEGIHVYQQYECGLAGGLIAVPLLILLGAPLWVTILIGVAGFLPFIGWFYWVYAITWVYWSRRSRKVDVRNLKPGEKGYYLIPFEREAYLYDGDGLAYFKKRKWFAWVRIKDDELAREGAELSEHLFGNIISLKKA